MFLCYLYSTKLPNGDLVRRHFFCGQLRSADFIVEVFNRYLSAATFLTISRLRSVSRSPTVIRRLHDSDVSAWYCEVGWSCLWWTSSRCHTVRQARPLNAQTSSLDGTAATRAWLPEYVDVELMPQSIRSTDTTSGTGRGTGTDHWSSRWSDRPAS